MTFLYTVFIPALAAATIPILLHLLSRRRLPLISFSTLEFLQKLQKKKSRRVQLKQLILLIIRTLAIIALVLVFARPALRGNQAGTGSAAAVEIALVVDNSLNAATETRDGQILRLTTSRAQKIFELCGAKDRITLIPSASPSRRVSVGSGQLDLLRDRLENLGHSFWSPLLSDTRSQIDSLLAETPRFNREIYFIGGFYSPQWESLSLSDPGETERRYLLPVGPDNNPNLSVDKISIGNAILQRNRPIEINATLSNHSSKSADNALVSVYLDGERVAQSSVDIPGNGTVIKDFAIVPDKSGKLACSVKWENIDPFKPDDRRWTILDIPDSLRVLAIAPQSVSRVIIEAALSASEASFVKVTWADPVKWETMSLAGFDVILLVGIKSTSAGASERVAEFVNQGGGAVIFQNPEADLSGLSRGLWNKLGFAGAKGLNVGEPTGWGNIDLEHPVFNGVFDEKGKPRTPLFDFSVDLAVGKNDQVIIPLSNGRPFLMERQVNRGRVLMFAVPVDPTSSNFVYSGIFSPLLLRSLSYVASGSANGSLEWETGKSYKVILPLSKAQNIQMAIPDGDQVELIPRPVVGGVEYDVGQIGFPGVYDFKIGNRIVARYAANIPVDQSDLRRRDLGEFAERIGNCTVISADDDNPAETINQARFGREIWSQIAAIFIALLLVESVLGHSGKREEV